MTGLATNFVEYFKGKREAALETMVRITFGTFMGGRATAHPALLRGADRLTARVTIWRLPAPPSKCWLSFACSRSGASRQYCMRAWTGSKQTAVSPWRSTS